MKGNGRVNLTIAVFICISMVLFTFGMPGTLPARAAHCNGCIEVLHFDDDGLEEPLMDLSGIVIGHAMHTGDLSCNRQNCNGRTNLTNLVLASQPTDIVIEYKIKSLLARDQAQERVVVAGTGTITSGGQTERFTFTAIFQNNLDGTLYSSYSASRPDASFLISQTPGTFVYGREP